MGRKPKRQRDPARSHGRAQAVVQVTREPCHGSVETQGSGWISAKLSVTVLQELLKCLEETRLTGPAFTPFSKSGEQATHLPGRQRALHGSTLWRKWQPGVEAALADLSGLTCPQCHACLGSHELVAADLNVMRPGAALWPHTDVYETLGKGRFVVVLLLLQPAATGGQFRVALEAGHAEVAWRAVDGASTLARRDRDTVLVPLFAPGDGCVVDGGQMVHEVGRVWGTTPRVSVPITLRCRCS